MKIFNFIITVLIAPFAFFSPLIAEESSQDGVSFIAKGNEPFWSLEIGDGKIEFQRVGVEDIESADLPFSEPLRNDQTTVYATSLAGKPLTIVITKAVTADSMSGMQFPSEVVVVMPGEILRGVGGNPAELLAGDWSVSSLANTPVIEDAPVTLLFEIEEGRVSGSSSCNRYFGGYELTGESLTFEPLAGTRMACEEAKMDQELRFFALMETIDRFEINEAGELVLIASDEPAIVAVRAIE